MNTSIFSVLSVILIILTVVAFSYVRHKKPERMQAMNELYGSYTFKGYLFFKFKSLILALIITAVFVGMIFYSIVVKQSETLFTVFKIICGIVFVIYGLYQVREMNSVVKKINEKEQEIKERNKL